MSTTARKARKRSGVQFQRTSRYLSGERIPEALYTPEGEVRTAEEVEAALAELGTSIAEVHEWMGLGR